MAQHALRTMLRMCTDQGVEGSCGAAVRHGRQGYAQMHTLLTPR